MVKEKVINITKKLLRAHGCSKDEVEKYSGKIVIKRWNFGAKKRAQSESASYDAVTGQADFDIWEFTIQKFLGCVVEAPFTMTRDEVVDLPDFLGEIIEDAINEVIDITLEQVKNLGLSSNKEL